MKPVRINVLIATHGRCDLLGRSLDSLAAARKPSGFQSVIVVENGSDDGSRGVCESAKGKLPVQYHHRAKPGKSRALQWAIEELRDGFVIFLDDDIRVSPDFFERYVESIEACQFDTGYFFGGPLKIDYEGELPPEWLRKYLPPSVNGWEPVDPEDPLPGKQRFSGANFGVFVQDTLAVGGFNHNLGPGAQRAGTEGNPTGQEYEFQTRLLQHGFKPVFVHGADVWHYVPRERCTVPWMLHRFYRNALATVLRAPASSPMGRTILGAPRGKWKALVKAALGAIRSFLAADPARRFELQCRFVIAWGEIKGYRLRARVVSSNDVSKVPPSVND